MTIKKYIFILGLLIVPVFSFAQTGEQPTACTMQYQPVCALKQVQCITAPCYPVYQTYGNSCMMSAAKATFVHEGECTGNEPAQGTQVPPYVPPANCTAYYDGCNSCSKQANGMVACTLRACTTQQAGYCTAYSTKPTTTVSTTTTVVTSTSTVGNVPVIQPEIVVADVYVDQPNFFKRIWNWIKGIFGK